MALSLLLRNGCKLKPAYGTALQLSKLSSAAYICKINFVKNHTEKYLNEKPITVSNLNQIVRRFSASPILKSSIPGHDHAKIWNYEKMLSLALLAICPLSIMVPNVLFDILLAVSVVMHLHWGVEAIVIDYVRPIIFGSLIPKIAHGLVYVLSIFILVGLFNLTFNNSGIGNSIRLLWKI